MSWKKRLQNGLQKLQLIPPVPVADRPHRGPSLDLQSTRTLMTEALPGFSQPVWGPEISTVGAYSREGYTSRTFDRPVIDFRTQADALQVDEDVQLAINHLASMVTGGQHYIKAEDDFIADYFERFTESIQFDIMDTIVVKELLWYGNSVWKPRMGIREIKSADDLMHIPISSFVHIWWDRQRIPYKYEFRGAEYQGYHNPGEIIHFLWNPINASVFGTGFGVSMTSPRLFSQPTADGDVAYRLPPLLERKYSTQFNMQIAEQRYISRNVYVAKDADEPTRENLQAQVDNLGVGQDFVAGTDLEVQELGSQARNFNSEQFMDITLGPIMKALNDFRSKEGGSEQHSYSNMKTQAQLGEIGLSAFPIAVRKQFEQKLLRPWYEGNPLPDPMTGGMTYQTWPQMKVRLMFGEQEKKDIPVEDMIKLLDSWIATPVPKDAFEIRKLYQRAGLPFIKDYDPLVPPGTMVQNPMPSMDGGFGNDSEPGEYDQSEYDAHGKENDFSEMIPNMLLPQHDIGGGQITPPYFNNQNVGSPPMDMPIYDSMAIDIRGPSGVAGDLKNSYKRGNQSQDWNYGRGYE